MIALRIARGDAPRITAPTPSPLPGVSAAAWSRFKDALSTQALGGVSESEGLGRFEMRPRRLGDLGIMVKLQAVRRKSKRQVWRGDFAPPLTQAKFLASALAQYGALVESTRRYDADLDLAALPDGVTRSGALALLHRGGPGALQSWPDLFPATRAIFERANGIF